MSSARASLLEVLHKLDQEAEKYTKAPVATPVGEHRRLCVGLATFDDFDGAWFTVMSALMYHQEVADQISFVVIDNHPEGPYAQSLKALESVVPHFRYVPFSGYRGTAVRDLVFREANSDIVCCVDSHLLLRPGALRAVLDYFDAHPESRDLLQGPMMSPDLSTVQATHMDPEWQNGMFGRWAVAPEPADVSPAPTEIPLQGLALFACRRDAWPGFNPRFRGFGGEEGYLHEKVRQRGGRVLCLDELGWVHRFDRPSGIPYQLNWADRVRNYRIGWSEVGWDVATVEDHFRAYLGVPEQVEPMLAQVRCEHLNPFDVFDAIFCLSTDSDKAARLSRQLSDVDVAWRVEWRTAFEDGMGHPDVQWTSAWRESIRTAQHRGYESIVLLSDDADPRRVVASARSWLETDLSSREWQVWDLAGDEHGEPSADQRSTVSDDAARPWVAVHRRAFAEILHATPAEPTAIQEWLDTGHSIGQYVTGWARAGRCEAASNVAVSGRA